MTTPPTLDDLAARIAVLEANAVKTKRVIARLRAAVAFLWSASSGVRAAQLARMPDSERKQAALQLENLDTETGKDNSDG